MKFSFKQIPKSRARSGRLFEFHKSPDKCIETPLLLLNTKSGSVPHITNEVLQMITKKDLVFQVPLPSTIMMHEAVKEYSKGIAKFCGLKDHYVYCSGQDPCTETPSGYNNKTTISVWSHSGRMSVNVEKYMDVMEAFQPDFYQTLSNSDTGVETTKKKLLKTTVASKILFEACLKRHQSSDSFNHIGIVGVVEGGYDFDVRRDFAKFIASKPVNGFAIEGLHNGPQVETQDDSKPLAVIEETLKYLPEDKFRIVHGCWTPQTILKLVDMGIDVFDSSLPIITSERMSALTFQWKTVPMNFENKDASNSMMEISLKDEKFKEDFDPLLPGCSCLPCKKHTKAYVYHLIDNKELLASVLLMMHNIHHYMEFFDAIRHALNNNEKVILV